jgi:hypothetical protein
MWIRYTKTVNYACGCSVDEDGDLDTLACDRVENKEEYAGVDVQPAPSESERTANCPVCSAKAASPSTELDTPSTTETQNPSE